MTDRAPAAFGPANDANGVGEKYLFPLARLLMSSLLIRDGLLQLRNPAGTAQYLARVHVPVPDLAIWIPIPVHLIGGLVLGFRIRWAAALLALVRLGTASACICLKETRRT